MSTQSISDAIAKLLWNAWTELGVPGVERRYKHVAMDLEPLIVFTPSLVQEEPRLTEQVSAWCAQHGHCVSQTRLWGLARKQPKQLLTAFTAFVDRLPGSAASWKKASARVETSHTSMRAPPVERPSLVRLRMRGLAGNGARADVFCELVAAEGRWMPSAHLDFLGYTRRTVERLFADLETSGIVARAPGKGAGSFRLKHPSALAKLVAADSLLWVDWSAVLLTAWHLLALEQSAAQLPPVAAVVKANEARGILLDLSLRGTLPEPPLTAGDESALPNLLRWGRGVLEAWPQRV